LTLFDEGVDIVLRIHRKKTKKNFGYAYTYTMYIFVACQKTAKKETTTGG